MHSDFEHSFSFAEEYFHKNGHRLEKDLKSERGQVLCPIMSNF
jgi:hypothetical protein